MSTCLSVLRLEAARRSAAVSRAMDEEILIEAVRAADLLIVHLASPQALADRLRGVETALTEP